MWEFYLAASEMAFREQAMMVFQIQLTKRQDVVPITRDYIAREEARLRTLEGGQPPAAAAGRRVVRFRGQDPVKAASWIHSRTVNCGDSRKACPGLHRC